MVTGERPFAGRTAEVIAAKRAAEPVPGPRALRESVPKAVDRTITRALAPLPAARFATAAEFAQALRALPPTSVAAGHDAFPRAAPAKRRKR